MKKTKILAVLLVVCAFCGLLFTGCAIGTPTVDLNDYVTVTDNGYDGYGTVHASIDFNQLIEDHADRLTDKALDTQYFGDKTPELAAQFVFSTYKPYALAYNAGENLKNGDKVEFSWNTSDSGIEQLSKILKVKIKYKDFDYTVKDLKALKEVNPFDHVEMEVWGVSGTGSVSPYLDVVIKTEDNELRWDLTVDTSKNGTLKNGDTVHVELEKIEDPEYYAKNYGFVLTQTEAELEMKDFAYYAYEKPEEVFEYLGGQGVDNALKAITEWVQVEGEERTIELVGAVYYHNNEGHSFKSGYNKNNQLLLIYHIDNGIVPGGWYTYLAPNNDVVVGYERLEDGSLKKSTVMDVEKVLADNYMYYQKELYISFSKYDHTITFEHDGVTYVGHKTIEDCINAYEANELKDTRQYDNVIADETLADYIK